jgi:hypothetical protein
MPTEASKVLLLPKKRSDRRGLARSPITPRYSLQKDAIFLTMKIWRLCVGVIVGLGFAQLMAESPSPRRDINAVLAAHDRQLLDLPAVVGVYVGVLADGKTPCLKVMLARPTPETERKIPREIEGYPVVTEISGEIRPLRP